MKNHIVQISIFVNKSRGILLLQNFQACNYAKLLTYIFDKRYEGSECEVMSEKYRITGKMLMGVKQRRERRQFSIIHAVCIYCQCTVYVLLCSVRKLLLYSLCALVFPSDLDYYCLIYMPLCSVLCRLLLYSLYALVFRPTWIINVWSMCPCVPSDIHRLLLYSIYMLLCSVRPFSLLKRLHRVQYFQIM